MTEPEKPFEIELTIRPPGREVNLPELIEERRRAQDEAEWQSTLGVDVSEEGLARSAAGGARMPAGATAPEGVTVDISEEGLARTAERAAQPERAQPASRLTPPQESTAEVVREKAAAAMQESAVRQIVRRVTESFIGTSLEEFDQIVATGKVSERLGTVLKGLDPFSNAAETMAREEAAKAGLPPELIEKIGTAAGLFAGLILPPGGGFKPGSRAAEALGKRAVVQAGKEIGEAGINLRRINAPEETKAVIKRLSELVAPRLKEARKTATHEETIEAGRGALTLEQALTIPDEVWLLEEMRAKQQGLRDLHVAVSEELRRLRGLAMKGDPQATRELEDIFPVALSIAAKNEMVGTGGGRLLEARKIGAEAARAAPYSVEELMRVRNRLGDEGVDGLTIARMLTNIPTRDHSSFLAKAWRYVKSGNDALHWLYLQFLLSNPVTHTANILGTGAMQAWHIPERLIAEYVNLIFRTGAEGVQRGETAALLRATGQGLTDGFRLMAKTIKTGEQPLGGAGRIETRFDVTAQQFGLDPNTPMGALANAVGMISPTRLMMTEDALYKGYVNRTELAALALREAKARLPHTATHADIAKLTAKLEANPTPEMLAMAKDAAHLRTLNAPLGVVGQAMMTIRNNSPGLFYLIPFLQTPINSVKWGWQRTPILSTFSLQNARDIAAGGATRDLAIARILMGNAVGAVIAYHVYQGNITGGMSAGSNKNLKRDLRALGPQSYSVRSGDEFYYYKRGDPLGQLVGTIATAIEIHSQLGARDPDNFDWGAFALASGIAAGRVALDTPFLTGLGNMLEAIERPDAEGKQIARGLARGLVPAGIRQLTATGIPGVLTPRPELRELESLLDVIKSGSFAFADDVPPYLHPITGDVVVRPPGLGPDILSPIYVTQRQNDVVLEEIRTHRMNFPEPSRYIFGSGDPDKPNLDPTVTRDGVRLNNHQYFRLKQIATQEHRNGDGRTLWEAMAAKIASESYRTRLTPGPDGTKELNLKAIYQGFYEKARVQLQKEFPSLADKVKAARKQRGDILRPRETLDLGPGLTIQGSGR